MIQNPVLFHIRGVPWTVGGISVALAALFLVTWICVLPIIARRYGTSRRMTTEEAQHRVFVGRDETYLTGKVLAGPAIGKRWEANLTIGELRAMRVRGDYVQWWLLPAFASLFLMVFFAGGIGLALVTRAWIFLGFTGMALLVMLVLAFMMWASVYTQLE